METHDLLTRLHKVKAPDHFEAGVFAKVTREKERLARRRTSIRLAFAGSAAVMLIGFVLLNFFVLQKKTPVTYALKASPKTEAMAGPAGLVGSAARPSLSLPLVPVMETLDYSSEFRNASYQPKTVYILEQVSEGMPSGVKF
jgi:hypothetical protein